MLCRWCEKEVVSKQFDLHDDTLNVFDAEGTYVWIHVYSDGLQVECNGSYPIWARNFMAYKFEGPSVATPDFNYEPHPRHLRAVERGLRNLLRGLDNDT